MLDTVAGGTFMGKHITEAKQLLYNMQDNHDQWMWIDQTRRR